MCDDRLEYIALGKLLETIATANVNSDAICIALGLFIPATSWCSPPYREGACHVPVPGVRIYHDRWLRLHHHGHHRTPDGRGLIFIFPDILAFHLGPLG